MRSTVKNPAFDKAVDSSLFLLRMTLELKIQNIIYMKHLLNTVLMTCVLSVGLGTSVPLLAKDKIKNEELAVRLQKLESLMQNQGLLDLLQTIDRLNAEVARLNGELEMQNYKLDKLIKSQENFQLSINERVGDLEAQSSASNSITNVDDIELSDEPALEVIAGTNDELDEIIGNTNNDGLEIETTNSGISRSSSEQAEETSEQVSETPAATETEIRAEYERAFQLLKDSKYKEAIAAFTKFQEQFGSSKYGDKAQYWLAETHYVNLDYKNAASEYEKILTLYPDSSKTSHSLLKLGFCYQELGNQEQAANSFTKVINLFPGTTAAQLADDRLRNIKANAAQSNQS